MRLAVATIANFSLLPNAAVLMASVRQHIPAADCFVLLSEHPDQVEQLQAMEWPNTVLKLTDLQISWRDLAFKYDRQEMSAAVKPALIAALLDRSYDAVIFLDATGRLYAPPAELLIGLERSDCILTPVVTAPFAASGPNRSVEEIARRGQFDTGLVAVRSTPHVRAFLSFWSHSLNHFCLIGEGPNFSGDAQSLSIAPSFIDRVLVLRNQSYNLATWNLFQRPLTWRPNGLETRDGAIVFLQFRGLSEDFAVSPPLSARETGGVQETPIEHLVREYQVSVQHSASQFSSLPTSYTFGVFTDGSPVLIEDRRKYWGLHQVERERLADPFSERAFLRGIAQFVPGQLETFDRILVQRRIADLRASRILKAVQLVTWPLRQLLWLTMKNR